MQCLVALSLIFWHAIVIANDFVQPQAVATPTVKLSAAEYPQFSDDLLFEGIDLALDRQLERYKKWPPSAVVQLGEEKYTLADVQESLLELKKLAGDFQNCLKRSSQSHCFSVFDKSIASNFNIYIPQLTPDDPRYGEKNPALFTAYYTPLLEGSKTKSSEFPHPVYARPVEKSLIGSSRVAIDFDQKLEGRGLEIFYTKSLYDIYLLHVQGGGRIKFKDGTKTDYNYLSFDGTNGLSWRFISTYMLDKKYISSGSVCAQRKFLDNNPNLNYEIYGQCPSYVYFKTSNRPPIGSDDVSLTDGRSIATDSKLYPFKGLLTFIKTHRPQEDPAAGNCGSVKFRPFQRFFLDQDTGGAIKGKARVDLYFGEGAYAEKAAYSTTQRGDLFYLMIKK